MAEYKLCDSISNRRHFGALLQSRGLMGHAVEVGTQRAWFAMDFYNQWGGKTLYCVDPWANPPGYAETNDPAALEDRERDFRVARKRMRRFGGNAQLIRATSLEAVEQFKDNSLDFVYIDADHRYQHVVADCRAWWTKVRPGGILAGHDITGVWEHEVWPAVEQFAVEHDVQTVWIVLGDAVRENPPYGDAASWFIEKA